MARWIQEAADAAHRWYEIDHNDRDVYGYPDFGLLILDVHQADYVDRLDRWLEYGADDVEPCTIGIIFQLVRCYPVVPLRTFGDWLHAHMALRMMALIVRATDRPVGWIWHEKVQPRTVNRDRLAYRSRRSS